MARRHQISKSPKHPNTFSFDRAYIYCWFRSAPSYAAISLNYKGTCHDALNSSHIASSLHDTNLHGHLAGIIIINTTIVLLLKYLIQS